MTDGKQITITLTGNAREIFEKLQRAADNDSRVPTFTDAELVHYALVIMDTVAFSNPSKTVRDVLMDATLRFERERRNVR